jgi:hypothetical protein
VSVASSHVAAVAAAAATTAARVGGSSEASLAVAPSLLRVRGVGTRGTPSGAAAPSWMVEVEVEVDADAIVPRSVATQMPHAGRCGWLNGGGDVVEDDGGDDDLAPSTR